MSTLAGKTSADFSQPHSVFIQFVVDDTILDGIYAMDYGWGSTSARQYRKLDYMVAPHDRPMGWCILELFRSVFGSTYAYRALQQVSCVLPDLVGTVRE